MPIYEYECTSCHHHFDLIQRISETPAKQCPQCFQNTAIRLVSAPGFQLKGSGWYATDFKNNGRQPAAQETPTTKSANDASVSKADTKTESATTAAKETPAEKN